VRAFAVNGETCSTLLFFRPPSGLMMPARSSIKSSVRRNRSPWLRQVSTTNCASRHIQVRKPKNLSLVDFVSSRKEACFHVVGGIKALVKSPILLIAEGYATAATLSQTLGFATVAAFDSGNLVPVAKALREKYPKKQIVIAGDDDKHLDLTHGINPGRRKAEEAARSVGGKLLLPIFAPNENSYLSSLEAVTPQKFRTEQLSDKQHAALAKMKQYTDFNDLATKSVLGSEAVERQGAQ
jgi:Toprim domain